MHRPIRKSGFVRGVGRGIGTSRPVIMVVRSGCIIPPFLKEVASTLDGGF
jgi:hypothetical protein